MSEASVSVAWTAAVDVRGDRVLVTVASEGKRIRPAMTVAEARGLAELLLRGAAVAEAISLPAGRA